VVLKKHRTLETEAWEKTDPGGNFDQRGRCRGGVALGGEGGGPSPSRPGRNRPAIGSEKLGAVGGFKGHRDGDSGGKRKKGGRQNTGKGGKREDPAPEWKPSTTVKHEKGKGKEPKAKGEPPRNELKNVDNGVNGLLGIPELKIPFPQNTTKSPRKKNKPPIHWRLFPTEKNLRIGKEYKREMSGHLSQAKSGGVESEQKSAITWGNE